MFIFNIITSHRKGSPQSDYNKRLKAHLEHTVLEWNEWKRDLERKVKGHLTYPEVIMKKFPSFHYIIYAYFGFQLVETHED